MWKVILNIISQILGLFKSKADKQESIHEKINTKEFQDATKKQNEVSRQDENEKLVKAVDGKSAESDKALNEIRKRLG
jgi:hypothetical protein